MAAEAVGGRACNPTPGGSAGGRAVGMRPRLEAAWAYALIAPALLVLSIFMVGPMLGAIYISLTQYDLLTPPYYVGLENYKNILRDSTFWTALRNTLVYFTGVPVGMGLALILAINLNDRRLTGADLYRVVYFTPVVVPLVAIGAIWLWIFNAEYGAANAVLKLVGLPKVNWLGSYEWSKISVIITGVWQGFGSSTVVLLGGLQNIPHEVYEAAQIDGARGLALVRFVTLPLLAPSLVFVGIMSSIASFQIFDLVMVMTGGGPGRSSMSLVQYIYEKAFNSFEMGYGSAIAVVLFVILLAFSIAQFMVGQRWLH